MTRDLRTSEPRTPCRMFENLGHAWLEFSRTACGCNRGAAPEADAIREQQLKQTQAASSSSAQRAVRRRIIHVGEQEASSLASKVSEATCMSNCCT